MSRLEQMREDFLRKIHHERFLQCPSIPSSSSSSNNHPSYHSRLMARSTLNIPESLWSQSHQRQQHQDYRKTPVRSTLSAKLYCRNPSSTMIAATKTTISRVRSLNSVNITQSQESVQAILKNIIDNRRASSQNIVKTTTTANCIGNVNNQQLETNRHHSTDRRNSNCNNNNRNNQNLNPTLSSLRTVPDPVNHHSNEKRLNNSQNSNNNNNNKNKLQCQHCQRKFAAKDRLEKHMDICAKIFQKQRPVFQSSKQRRLQQQQQQQQREELLNNDDHHDEIKIENNYSYPAKHHLKKISSGFSESKPMDRDRPTSKSNWKMNRQHFLEKLKQDRLKNREQKSYSKAMDLAKEEVVRLEENMANMMMITSSCKYCERKFKNETILKQHETFCNKHN